MAIFLPGFGGVTIFDTPFAGQEHLFRRETGFRPCFPFANKNPGSNSAGICVRYSND